jgi:hypothetical protein
VKDFLERLDALHADVLEQEAALGGLAEALALEAERLHRRDQVRRLSALRAMVQDKVSLLQEAEAEAHLRFSEGKLLDGVFQFAIGGLTAALRQAHEHPLSTAARRAKEALSQSALFGRVVVLVGPGGVPDGVAVVSLSALAREARRAEAEAEEALRRKGFLVLTPQAFTKGLDLLVQGVLGGVVALPVPADRLRSAGARNQS